MCLNINTNVVYVQYNVERICTPNGIIEMCVSHSSFTFPLPRFLIFFGCFFFLGSFSVIYTIQIQIDIQQSCIENGLPKA